MNITTHQTWHGWYYCLTAPDGFFAFCSKLSFASQIAAVTMAHLDLLEQQLWQRENPTAFFDIDTGEILSVNEAFRAWLRYDPIGLRCDKLPAMEHFSTCCGLQT